LENLPFGELAFHFATWTSNWKLLRACLRNSLTKYRT